jgi:hypothetical protein
MGNRSAAQERQRVLDEMTREAMRQQNELLQTLARDFEATVVRQMNLVAYEAATDLLAAIERNGRPNSRNIVTLKNMIQTLREANFTDNAEIEAMIAQAEAQLDAPAKEREVKTMDLVLRDIAIVARQNILALGGETDTPARPDPRRSERRSGRSEPPPPHERDRGRHRAAAQLRFQPSTGVVTPNRAHQEPICPSP